LAPSYLRLHCRYINFNAYVQTCIWGTGFCKSAFNAFWLIFRNIARIAAVSGVTAFLGFIGKVSVVMGTAGRWVSFANPHQTSSLASVIMNVSSSFYYVMDAYYADTVSSLVLPTMIVGVMATFIAIMFFEVFGMGTTVLLQCFIAGWPSECHIDPIPFNNVNVFCFPYFRRRDEQREP
jgi:solute carrier family 44 (choline transporter-like protein), member 2/4/5